MTGFCWPIRSWVKVDVNNELIRFQPCVTQTKMYKSEKVARFAGGGLSVFFLLCRSVPEKPPGQSSVIQFTLNSHPPFHAAST
jgi:hypothetical protein